MTIGYDNGDIELILNQNYGKRMSVKYHDAHTGKINCVAFNSDETFMLTAAEDGLIFVHQFDKLAALEQNTFDPLADE